jgi:hypothetical protein
LYDDYCHLKYFISFWQQITKILEKGLI